MRYIASDRPRELALTTGKHLYAPCAAFLASMARACTGLLLLSAASALRQPQTVTLRDAHSKRDVTLVGAMHYNPVQDPCPLTFESLTPSTQVSIALAERCVEEQEGLGAVVVESCESRWRRTQEVSPPGSIGRVLLPSEMLAAAEAAEERGVPISLGDTDVGELGPRLKELLVASLMDLLSPGEGWKRIGDDLRRGARLAFDTSDLDGDALEFSDFLKPDLLLGFVTSLLAYPAAALVKAPIPVGGLLVGSAFGANYLESAAREADALAAAGGDSSASYLLLSGVLIVLDILFPIVFGRLLLVAMLEERNVRLARSITEAADRSRGNVVAVLGALHVNGVARLLKDPSGYGEGKAGTWWTDDMIEAKEA